MPMDFYGRKNLWKFLLLLFAILIGAATLFYTESFLAELRQEEVKKANQWATAMQIIQRADNETDLTLPTLIIQSNQTIPVILTNAQDSIITAKNFQHPRASDRSWLEEQLQEMKAAGQYIEVNYAPQQRNFLYYQNSNLLRKLRLYPIVLLVVISLFVLIAYLAFSGARKAEQNRIWNGLAKETAHQIGTPLSSLMGWLELLKQHKVNQEIAEEMDQDIRRLETITNRFSKIGSKPSREKTELGAATAKAVSYLQSRSPNRIRLELEQPSESYYVRLNLPLFEWVVENLVRNAIDAIEREGFIRLHLEGNEKHVRLEVQDNGRGIPSSRLKAIFRPGYSTKKRGWGLGLSLAKRIVEDYHHGRIFVAQSQTGQGTTFRIQLRRLKA